MSDEKNLVQGETGPWEVVIGLEIHAQIASNAKLFSGAPTEFGAEPNSQVSFVDAGFPGMLPVINKFCVEQAIKTGLGLNAQINPISVFDRKNYFYADLPTGYQISQNTNPIVGEGEIEIELADETTRTIGIERLHLEQDAGKSIHDLSPNKSYIDLNRAGVALMEIVTRPDMRSSEEAVALVKKVRTIVRYLGTCDGNMEQGSMRADVNVSVRKPNGPLGTRAEIKNVNSMRFMQQAIAFEINRQIMLLEDGGNVVQETRLFDANIGETRSMRTKEDAHDYRYFPDPDLPPLHVDESEILKIKENLPELPDQKKHRFMDTLGLSAYDASVLVSELETANFYEEVLEHLENNGQKGAKLAANWMITELFGALKKDSLKIQDSKVLAKDLALLVDLIQDGTISGKIAKDVFADMWDTGKPASEIVKTKGLEQISDEGPIEECIAQILSDNSDKVEEFRAGKDKLKGFFVGQVMKAMAGKANPQLVNQILDRMLKG